MTGDPLRILLVSSSSGSHGGGELYLDMLAEGLTALGHSVESLLAAHPRMDVLSGMLGYWGPVHRTEFIVNTYDRKLRSLGTSQAGRTITALTRSFRRLGPDVVHINKQNVEDGLDLLAAARECEIPSVCTVHVTRGMTELGSAFGRVRDWTARRRMRQYPGQYVAIARAGRRQLLRFLHLPESHGAVHAVPNGVRSWPDADRREFRREWGVADGDVVLGCASRMESQKDPLFALDLLAKLPSNVKLVWVGDGRLRNDFERKASELGLAERVHVDGWRYDARKRMCGFDIFLLPSLYEGLPFAVLEAMSAGLPCVVSEVDGACDAVVEGVTGWLCPVRKLDAWLPRLTELATRANLRECMGAAGRRRVEVSFSLEAMARGTTAVYAAARRFAPVQPAGVE